ncbi:hypothetical protein E5288_WYG006704 [Bos mutus]|uniref:Complement C5 n=1 Tax=Bos mutus TaxID=72004 RepID=A0A6B0REU5_9CETA|nr:hypothetical protein [Bos mutus]
MLLDQGCGLQLHKQQKDRAIEKRRQRREAGLVCVKGKDKLKSKQVQSWRYILQTRKIQPKELSGGPNAISHVYLEALSAHFSKAAKISLRYDNGFLVIQTDKSIYDSDQSVNVRVYSLDENLKPLQKEITLTFIVQVRDVFAHFVGPVTLKARTVDKTQKKTDLVPRKSTTNYTDGVASFMVNIPSDVTALEFHCYSDLDNLGHQLELILPDFLTTWEIQAVGVSNKGLCTADALRLQVYTDDFPAKNNSVTRVHEKGQSPARKLRELEYGVWTIRAKYKEDFSTTGTAYFEIKEYEPKSNFIGYKDFTNFEITIRARYFYNKVVNEADVYITFGIRDNLEDNQKEMMQKAMQSTSVQVKDSFDHLVGGIPVTLSAKTLDANQEITDLESKKSVTRSSDGVASFVVNLPSEVTVLEFNIKTEDLDLPEENQASEDYRAILSKGKIVHFGTRDKLSDSAYQSINIPVTQDMVPSARLLVYYIVTGEQTAELVSDSVWLNIEEKCGNQLEVHLSPETDAYSPGQRVSLNMETELDSWVALTAVDSAIFGVQRTAKRPLERVFQTLEKGDLGCGAGGGRDNAEVFYLAGLTFLTNANADDTRENDEPCKEILRPKRMLKKKIEEEAAKYRNAWVKKCCYDGAHRNDDETCEQRAARIQAGPICIKAFKSCCAIASQFRADEHHKNMQLGRLHIKSLLPVTKPEIRSYFPESWLWEVHRVPKRNQLQFVLPDSLTTWEIQGVGISNSGICVANTLKAKVFKSVFLEMNIPYSVVRGEQIQLSGTVYNYRTSGIQFCVKMHPVEGICSSGTPVTDSQGRRFSKCVPQKIEGSSNHLVTFTVLPLEVGLHNLSFSLETSVGNEILVKTLRVVPEGVKRESYAGVTLDPQGVYGIISRRKEFPYRIPLNMVPKTKVKRTVSIKGLLIGEIMSAVLSQEGIDSLTRLPKGNAEAELMSVVPVFYVYHYLEAGHNWNIFSTNSLTQKQNLKTKLKEGMLSIMSFRNADYSYSVWKGGSASTWLTAFALRVLGQISKYVDQNQNSICNSLLWLLEKCQLENGSFKENSDYQPVKLQGTLPVEAREKTLYLTAFAVIGIRKAFDICPLEKISMAVSKADVFLHENALSSQSAFTLAIAAYALSLGDKAHPQFRAIVSALKRKAFVKGNPPIYRFWKDDLQQRDSFAPNTGTARMVETTAYALLTNLNLKDMNYVNPVIKWLSEEQRYGGGFYSTQDTINAIEGLTEYSLLVRKLRLNMDVKVSYKNKGDLYHYKMSDKYFLGRPIEVPLNDDLVVLSTGQSSGLATVHVKTVVHKISTSEEVCSFHLKIETREIEAFGYSSSEYKRIVACASYKLSSEESSSGSSHAVMDISLPTGVNANPEDLKALVEQVDQLLTDYEIKDGHVILQLNSIPSNEFLCVRFRIIELFEVGFLSPATFTVYEYHRPDKQCTMFYSTSNTKLQKVCEGVTCKCIEADCGQMQAELDLTISGATRKETACKPEIAYAYKVEIVAVTEENAFVKYTATLLDIYKAGEAAAERDAEITFIKKTSCSNANLEKRKQYLIMGKEALQIKHNFRFKYVYPLDSSTWIEYWPTDSRCPSCQRFLANLDEFTEDIFLNGCENA